MKIFVGGLMPVRQGMIRRAFPFIDFEFASDQEGHQKWLNRARRADAVIVDKARCDHTIVDRFNKARVHVLFADGNAEIRQLIEEVYAKQ